jgi:hypothetical protein
MEALMRIEPWYSRYVSCTMELLPLKVIKGIFLPLPLKLYPSKGIKNQSALFILGMLTYTYERQDIIQNALKRLPGGEKWQQRHLRYTSEPPTFYQSNLAMRNTVDMTGGTPIAICCLSISGVNTVNFFLPN